MGFTPLDGVIMETRSGSLDPGILLHLLKSGRLSVEDIEHSLLQESGLKGISGTSQRVDMLESAVRQGDGRARLALEMYVDRIRAEVGRLAVTLGQVDALVFTGGTGENSAEVRESVCDRLELIGLQLDRQSNRQVTGEADIATSDSRGRILVIPACEELAIFRAVRSLVYKSGQD
jgi:acetate kinase